jgi:hypothetical protein
MHYGDFVKGLYSKKGDYGNVVAVTTHYDHQIIENDKGNYYVDGILVESKLKNLEEVKQYIELQEVANKTKIQLYEDISDIKLAGIIRKYNENTKVTTKLIESYMSLASSKIFSLDPVLLEMRKTYKVANIFESKIDFRLNDNKQVAISEQTLKKIENLLNNTSDKKEIIDYMRENINNFLYVVKQL